MDAETLEPVRSIPDPHDGGVLKLALSSDGALLASAGTDGFVRVWDFESLDLVHEAWVTNGAAVGVVFADDDRHLFVGDRNGGDLFLITIDPDELIDIARSRITRTFTDQECTTYNIDPCPTLEEVQAG